MNKAPIKPRKVVSLVITIVLILQSLPLTAADTTPPTAPTGMTATAISSSQINLSWTASTDDVGVAGYKIYRNGSLLTTQNSQLTTYSDTGLQPQTTYTYAVSAYDVAGNESAQSTPAGATTLTQTRYTYYISPTGSDTKGDGSETNPWATVNYAVAQTADFDTIKIMPGTYTLTNYVNITGKTGLTLTAYDINNKPVLTKSTERVIWIASDAADIEVSYLVLDNGSRRTTSYWYGIVYILGVGAHIHHNEIRDGWSGVEIAGGHSHEIDNNLIHNFGTVGTSPESGSGFGIIHSADSVLENGATSWDQKVYIHHNTVYDAGGDSYQCEDGDGVNYVEIAYNDFYGNDEDSIDLKYAHNFRIHHNKLHGNAGSGVSTHSNQASTNVEFYNNEVYDNGWWGVFVSGGVNWKIYNNLIYENARDQSTYGAIGLNVSAGNSEVYHNTVYNNTKAGYNGNVPFKNNALYYNGDTGGIIKGSLWGNIHDRSSGIIDSNYVYPSSPGITGTNAVTVPEPKFTNINANDFTLQFGSPLINTGVDAGITTDFLDNSRPQGFGFDIGASEHVDNTAGNTFYISPSGNDSTGNGSNTSPWATLSKAFSQMKGGDTLVIKDGMYTGDSNALDNIGADGTLVIPPNGSPGNYTIIRAENEGKVTFDGEGARKMFNLTAPNRPAQYLEFRGIKWVDIGGGPVVFISSADYIKMLHVGAGDSLSISSSARPFYVTKSSYILLEDAYAWGAGRYKFQFFVSDHIICRRCVARTDATEGFSGSTPSIIAVFQNYCSQYVEYQNCIAIDTDMPQYWTNYSGLEGAYTSHPYCATFDEYSENTAYRGSIALNNRINGSGVFTNSSRNFSFIDFAGWDTGRGLWGQTPSIPYNYIIEHSLFGNMKGGTKSHGVYDSSTIGSTVVGNSILYDNEVNGLRGVASSNYNSFYANGTDYLSISPGPNGLSAANGNAINLITGTPGNGVPALKYLLRIEDGSDLDGAASDGGDIGPTILTKIGVSGTMYGDPGYNTDTGEPLWPFPYEDTIKQAFASYNPGGTDPTKPDGKRGFAADGNDQFGNPLTLTRYIWQYLGNQIPCEIYNECGGAPDTQAPTTPANLTATAVSSSQIDLSWTASTDNVGVAGYKIYRDGALVASYPDTNLQPSTTYSYQVSAYDAAGNESAQSDSLSVTTLAASDKISPQRPKGLRMK